jgi:hypothetical protein
LWFVEFTLKTVDVGAVAHVVGTSGLAALDKSK